MVGILIALQIQNWNASRIETGEVNEYLQALLQDFRENLDRIDESAAEVNQRREAAIRLRKALAVREIPADTRSLKKDINRLFGLRKHRTVKKAYNEILNTGSMRKINSKALKSTLGDWEAELNLLETTEARLESYQSAIANPYWNEHIALGELLTSNWLNKDLDIGKTHFKTDLGRLANDPRFDNILVTRISQMSHSLDRYEDLRVITVKLIQMLEDELNG